MFKTSSHLTLYVGKLQETFKKLMKITSEDKENGKSNSVVSMVSMTVFQFLIHCFHYEQLRSSVK